MKMYWWVQRGRLIILWQYSSVEMNIRHGWVLKMSLWRIIWYWIFGICDCTRATGSQTEWSPDVSRSSDYHLILIFAQPDFFAHVNFCMFVYLHIKLILYFHRLHYHRPCFINFAHFHLCLHTLTFHNACVRKWPEKLRRYAPTKENPVEPYLSINQH